MFSIINRVKLNILHVKEGPNRTRCYLVLQLYLSTFCYLMCLDVYTAHYNVLVLFLMLFSQTQIHFPSIFALIKTLFLCKLQMSSYIHESLPWSHYFDFSIPTFVLPESDHKLHTYLIILKKITLSVYRSNSPTECKFSNKQGFLSSTYILLVRTYCPEMSMSPIIIFI